MLSNQYSKTTVICSECGRAHPARSYEQDGMMFLETDCPHGKKTVRLSSDARLFNLMREKAVPAAAGAVVLTHNHVLHITDRCNLACPVCFADSGHDPWCMTLEDLRFRAAAIKKDRGYFVTLSGGEPTEHPRLSEIVSILHHEFHLEVSILTNGIKLGQESGLAASLKKAGLRKAVISFDTFNPEVSKLIRGDDLVNIKLQAFHNCWAASLNTGISATICRQNLHEVGELLNFGLQNVPRITLLLFQPYQTVGRCPQKIDTVDREEILKEAALSNVIPELHAEDFFPMPLAQGFGLCVHPDCGSMQIVSVSQKNGIALLEKSLNLKDLLTALAAQPFAGRFKSRFRFVLRLLRYGGFTLLKRVFHWIFSPGSESIFIFGVDNLMGADRQDCERIKRCATRRCEKDGSMSPVCHHYAFSQGMPEENK